MIFELRKIQQLSSRARSPDHLHQMLLGLRCCYLTSIIFRCVSLTVEKVTGLLKDGKPLPNDQRFLAVASDNQRTLTLTNILPSDTGIYECVLKNTAGEARQIFIVI